MELIEIKYAFQQENENVIRVPRKNLAQPQYYNVFEHFNKKRNSSLEAPKLPSLTNNKSSNKNDNSRYIVLDFNPNQDHENDEDNINHNCLYSFLFNTDNTVHTKLCIPSKLPKSAILMNNNNLLDQMKGLYFKYIKSGCDQEINLSYTVRNAVCEFFENSTVKLQEIKMKEHYYKLFNVFDECGIEIFCLMSQSFQRFVKSDKISKSLLKNLLDNDLIDATLNNEDQVVSFRNAESFSRIKKQRSTDYHE